MSVSNFKNEQDLREEIKKTYFGEGTALLEEDEKILDEVARKMWPLIVRKMNAQK